MAMAVRWCNTERITWCSMTRASPEATESRHRATTHSISPRRPKGQQSTQRLCKNVPTLLAVSMAITMCRYYTTCIAQWRRFVAYINATKHRHRASTRSDSINRTCLPLFQGYISSSNRWKRARVALITIGVWHIKLMRST
jgi:hypothetical protein